MTTATKTEPAAWANWVWPDEVTTFAKDNDADMYLEPLREVLAHIFPNATRASVHFVEDPELRDVRSIDFRVTIPDQDVPETSDVLKLIDAWRDASGRILPCPKLWVFRLRLYAR